jgi:hypothetical protein
MAKPDLLDFLYNEPDRAAKAADRSKLEDKHARAWAEALARLDPNNPLMTCHWIAGSDL